MNLNEFLDKVNLDSLHRRLNSELNIDAEFEVYDLLDNGQISLEITIFKYLPVAKIKQRIDFEIFTRASRFDYMTLTFPQDFMISEIDRLVKISRIVEDHIKSALNS